MNSEIEKDIDWMIKKHPDITQIYLEGESTNLNNSNNRLLVIGTKTDDEDLHENNYKVNILTYLNEKYDSFGECTGFAYWATREQLSNLSDSSYDMERSIAADGILVYDSERGGYIGI